MQEAVGVSEASSIIPQWLRDGAKQYATPYRICTSKHVGELRLIARTAIAAGVLSFSFATIYAIIDIVWWHHKNATAEWNWLEAFHYLFLHIRQGIPVFAPLFAVLGAVLAWTYRVGSARLGVVDLFACEITTLCRVAAVFRTVHNYLEMFEERPLGNPSAGDSQSLSSQERYFLVFESNSHDLETLESRVVIHITEFYTYMKAVRDIQRTLAQFRPQPVEPGSLPQSVDARREAVRNIVYMLYLGLESARHAIDDLVEVVPWRAERTIVILISELEAYPFLCRQFAEHDPRSERLKLRVDDYRNLVLPLIDEVEGERRKEQATPPKLRDPALSWEPAYQLLDELKKLYELVLEPGAGAAVAPLPAVVDDERGVEDLVTSAVSTRLRPV